MNYKCSICGSILQQHNDTITPCKVCLKEAMRRGYTAGKTAEIISHIEEQAKVIYE